MTLVEQYVELTRQLEAARVRRPAIERAAEDAALSQLDRLWWQMSEQEQNTVELRLADTRISK